MKPRKTKSPAGSSGTGTPKVSSLQGESKSTATEVQLAKLLARLRHRPHHTHELRQCGISHPAGRVLNLVERGFLIESARVTTVDSDGFQHFGVALYTLIAEPNGQQPQ